MNEEQAFLDELREHPDDDVTRLVYADWLDERDDPRAVYLRAEVALARMKEGDEGYATAEAEVRSLGEGVDPRWLEQAGKRWDLVLREIDPARTINAIKLVREATAEGLHRAKRLVENLPSVLVFNSSRAKVEEVERTFDRASLCGAPESSVSRVAIEPTRGDDGYQLVVVYQHRISEFGYPVEDAGLALDEGYARLAEVFGVLPEQIRPLHDDLPTNLVDQATAHQVDACLARCSGEIELIVRLRQDLSPP